MRRRRLGRTDLEVSILGLGGVTICERPQEEVNEEVRWAYDQGIRYFDVAPQYMNSQELMGPALKPFRNEVVLACKTLERTADNANRELDDSLNKLCTDHFDLYQLHAMTTEEDYKLAMGKGGAIEALMNAKKAGKIRYAGFSAHNEEIALKLIASGLFDSMLVPLNFVSYEAGFGPRMLAAANEKGMGILALKSMAKTKLIGERTHSKCWYEPEDREEAIGLLLRYTLNLPGIAAAIPPGDAKLMRIGVEQAAKNCEPLHDEELTKLKDFYCTVEPLFPLEG
ncbi:General stress protein 69 [Poriferisphaera corsica]|uniref:General stress protein 69 n=1 Tax=Poriferisphaera corsica TaxID=2528020 RepID=A0A517YRF0_9BACT|nr:aldo/keto reductase [Poriferisphaera corsica]QDU32761.1 General stress protein 69 [Poriferisphaera corsica]